VLRIKLHWSSRSCYHRVVPQLGEPFRFRDSWRLFLPIVPWALIALIAWLILRHWGIGWIAWAALGALILIAFICGAAGSWFGKGDA
jgi:hypothetical protein